MYYQETYISKRMMIIPCRMISSQHGIDYILLNMLIKSIWGRRETTSTTLYPGQCCNTACGVAAHLTHRSKLCESMRSMSSRSRPCGGSTHSHGRGHPVQLLDGRGGNLDLDEAAVLQGDRRRDLHRPGGVVLLSSLSLAVFFPRGAADSANGTPISRVVKP